MKKFITNVEKLTFGQTYEVRCFERGLWQHDKYVENLEEAIERMQELMSEYDFDENDVEVIGIQYYRNIVDELPF